MSGSHRALQVGDGDTGRASVLHDAPEWAHDLVRGALGLTGFLLLFVAARLRWRDREVVGGVDVGLD